MELDADAEGLEKKDAMLAWPLALRFFDEGRASIDLRLLVGMVCAAGRGWEGFSFFVGGSAGGGVGTRSISGELEVAVGAGVVSV